MKTRSPLQAKQSCARDWLWVEQDQAPVGGSQSLICHWFKRRCNDSFRGMASTSVVRNLLHGTHHGSTRCSFGGIDLKWTEARVCQIVTWQVTAGITHISPAAVPPQRDAPVAVFRVGIEADAMPAARVRTFLAREDIIDLTKLLQCSARGTLGVWLRNCHRRQRTHNFATQSCQHSNTLKRQQRS